MTRRPFMYTPIAIALQTASLLIVASCVLGILISGVARQKSAVTDVEGLARVHFGEVPNRMTPHLVDGLLVHRAQTP